MRWIKAGVAAGAQCGAALVPVSALGAGHAIAAARLPCSASVSVADPAHGERTDVTVKTARGAWAVAIARCKTGAVKRTADANSAGRARLRL